MIERGEYAFFPKEEYDQRVQKASILMDEQNLDALFLLQTENLLYFTGYISFLKSSKHRPVATILRPGESPVLILPYLQQGDGIAFSHQEDIRLWKTDPVGFYVSTLKDLGLAKKRIGVEIGPDTNLAMAYLDFEKLKDALTEATWCDCSNLLFQCRKIKSPREIEYLTRAAELADKGIERAWRALRTGMTERKIGQLIASAYVEGGADETRSLIVRSDPVHSFEDTFLCNKYLTDRLITTGDYINVDTGCVYRGYHSDMMRSALIGEPDPKISKGYAAAVLVNESVREAVRPGMTIHELDQVRVKTIEENGFEAWLPLTGHCIGLSVHELPRICSGIHEVLEPGMAFSIEPTIRWSPYVFVVEDVVLVTEKGSETLNKCTRTLFIVE
ncbi:MAG: Xaa-Pro peptidase family protein [Anaerolineales bacterium]